MKKKILIAVLIIFVLLSGAVGLGFVNIRNACIDTMKAEVTTSEGCYYTDEDIEKAIFTVKEIYKNKEWPVLLMNIEFDEEESRKKLEGYHLAKTTEKENIIVLFCDYVVLKDFAAYSSGYYSGWSAILTRNGTDSEWEFADGGYA